MPDKEASVQKSAAIVINPETNKILGQISLVGNPVPSTEWISAKGHLHGFVIIDGWKHLRNAWIYQEDVLLRTDYGQRYFKIVTYPTEGENQGYLGFTSDLELLKKPLEQKTRMLTQRGFAFLQSLFSI